MVKFDQAILDHLKGQQAPVSFTDLLAATGADVVALSVEVVALEYAGLISSGEGEYPLYELAQVVPLGYTRAPICVSCVKCGECAQDDERNEQEALTNLYPRGTAPGKEMYDAAND